MSHASARTPLAELMHRERLNDPALARRAGTSKQQINKLRHGALRMSVEWAVRLAPHLAATPAQVLGAEPLPSLAAPGQENLPNDAPGQHPSPREASTLHQILYPQPVAADVPMYGAAETGEDGWMTVDFGAKPTGWVPRAPRLEGLENVYALEIIKDDMEPRYAPGEFVYVQRGRYAFARDHVVVVLRGGEGKRARVMVRMLVARAPGHLELRQHNPPRTMTLPVEQVEEIHRVMEVRDLMGA